MAEKSPKTGAASVVLFLSKSERISAWPGLVSGHGQANIDARPPDDLRQNETPLRNVEYQKRKQTQRHNANQSAAEFPADRFTAVDGNAGETENTSESW
ncbi:hypothetical protein HR38_28180 (plasmid) [Klebsiella michiganensis]|nr:hypothetical protein HR38_28180 [Klebsiella michiganensis]